MIKAKFANLVKIFDKDDVIKNYAKVIPYFKKYWFRTILALGLAIPIGCLDAVIALSLKPYMDIVMVDKTVESPWYIPVLIVAFTSVQGLLNYLSTYMNQWVGGKVTNDLKKNLYNKLMHKDSMFIDSRTSGDIMRLYNNDANTACGSLLNNLKTGVSRVFSSISLIAVLLYNSWELAIIAIIVLICAVVPLTKMRDLIKAVTAKSESASGKIITAYNEAFAGHKVVTAYNLYDYQNKSFDKDLDTVFHLGMKITQKTGWLSPMMHIMVSIGIAAVIGLGSYMIVTGRITSGNFVSFITALIMLYTPIKLLGNNAKNMQNALLALERVITQLEAVPKIQDKPDAKILKGLNKSITFKNVSFEYKRNKPVLKRVSFEVQKGETFALVGNSGGGKSTIVNLIPRFYDVKWGNVLIDGVDVRHLTLKSLRDNISVVFQDNFLFSGTIRENIMIGNLNATEEQLQAAIRDSYLEDFIKSLDKGLDTYIGERGVLLSGGQKQRIGIARAFLKNAPILILDEATSALDNQAEKIVQQAIENLMKERTVFVIAHRLTTVQNADRIAVIKDGELVELGPHSELINIEDGVYKQLYESQFTKVEASV
ncbi:MAG: ATP-binding cassette domain-containing protein [Cyanobacteria bacterium SIG26]|nr:ATP-binding cassette domain-containing protein [Cyanobacteria bacterium SIG26]